MHRTEMKQEGNINKDRKITELIRPSKIFRIEQVAKEWLDSISIVLGYIEG